MNHTSTPLSIFKLFKRSGREIWDRFAPFFFLAMWLPLSIWIGNGLIAWFHVNTHPATFAQGFWLYVIMLITSLCFLWFFSSLVLFVCNRTQSISTAFDLGLQRIFHILWGMMIYTLLFLLLFLVLSCHPVSAFIRFILVLLSVLGLIFISVYYVFVPFLLVLTDQPATSCFHDSYLYVKHHFWRTLFILFLICLNIIATYFICAILIKLILAILGYIYQPLRVMGLALFLIPHTLLVLLIVVPLVGLYVDRLSMRLALQKPETQPVAEPPAPAPVPEEKTPAPVAEPAPQPAPEPAPAEEAKPVQEPSTEEKKD